MPSNPFPDLLHAPLPDEAAWAALFMRADVPVLADTAALVSDLSAHEDDVDANSLGEQLAHDPLMTLKIMSLVSARRRERQVGDAETLISALVMLGIGPFFRAFGPGLPTVEDRLRGQATATDGFNAVLRRAQRAARFALGFAVHRMDPDAAVIHQAALLHDFAELLMWCHAPGLMLQVARRQAADPALRSATVQREVLHVELAALQHRLMQAWRLPALLVMLNDDRHAEAPQVRNVLLAIRLARHTTHGWHNAALPDDVADIASLLHLGVEPTRHLLHELDS